MRMSPATNDPFVDPVVPLVTSVAVPRVATVVPDPLKVAMADPALEAFLYRVIDAELPVVVPELSADAVPFTSRTLRTLPVAGITMIGKYVLASVATSAELPVDRTVKGNSLGKAISPPYAGPVAAVGAAPESRP
jgi:hypothetical protein